MSQSDDKKARMLLNLFKINFSLGGKKIGSCRNESRCVGTYDDESKNQK